jgi:hypothetical protein
MKLTKYALIAAAAACSSAFAAETAYTSPVGYVTVPIPGTGGVGTTRLQLASQQLLPSGSTEFAGAAESFSGNTLTDDQGTWSAGSYVNPTPPSGFPSYSHLVEITSGPLTGTFTWITGSAANTITTYDNISAAGAGATYRVVKAFTVGSLLGNPPSATTMGGGTATTADLFLLYASNTGGYTTFYYKTSGLGGTGWRTTASTSVDVSTVAIHPTDSGLVFQRKQSGDGSLVISGDVKTGATDVLIRGGGGGTGYAATTLNIVQALVPTNQISLGGSALYTGSSTTGLAGGTATTADLVLIYNATTKAYTTYYYKTSGLGGTGWRSTASTSVDESATLLPSNSAILVQRKAAGDFIWQAPAVTIGQ